MKLTPRLVLGLSGIAALALIAWEALVDIPAAGGGLWCFDWRGPCSAGLAAVLIEMFLTAGVVLGYGAWLAALVRERRR